MNRLSRVIIGSTIGSIIGIFIGFSVARTVQLSTDKDYYGWPAVTQCRVCDKTVWEWQSYERRNFSVKNTGNYQTDITASGLVHKDCKGNPVFECNVSTK